MKTNYINMAILVTAFVSQTAAATLGANRNIPQVSSPIEVNIEAEITDHINTMLAQLQTPKITADLNMQLNINNIKLKTDKSEQNMGDALPKYKVVVAD